MKLTKRGRDYLKAIIILALVSSFFDMKSMIALSFTLAIAALASFIVLASISFNATTFKISPERTRLFKGEEFPISVLISFRRARWVSMHLTSLKLPDGILAKSEEIEEGKVTLLVKSPYAGVFRGLNITIELRDTLGLFSKEFNTIESPFELESLPSSILLPAHTVRALPLSVGERSGRTRGSSLELYALEEYQPYGDTKNLLWKKIARMPDEKLVVRVREAMVPKVVRVGLVENQSRGSSSKLRFTDLLCEGVGALCSNLFAAGSSVEIVAATSEIPTGVRSFLLSGIDEMTDALIASIRLLRDNSLDANIDIIERSDIVVTGLLELEEESLALAISKKPSLLIEEEARPKVMGKQVLIFTGVEEVRGLISKVIEK